MTNSDVPALRSAFRGELIGPGDGCYDELSSVFNAMTDRFWEC